MVVVPPARLLENIGFYWLDSRTAIYSASVFCLLASHMTHGTASIYWRLAWHHAANYCCSCCSFCPNTALQLRTHPSTASQGNRHRPPLLSLSLLLCCPLCMQSAPSLVFRSCPSEQRRAETLRSSLLLYWEPAIFLFVLSYLRTNVKNQHDHPTAHLTAQNPLTETLSALQL